ncbi:MAG: tRNA 4-thiouridine(8) synthase ThiI [Desulfobacterales bacterium]
MKPSRKPIKVVGLLSGGLDSTLAAKLMIEEGFDVYAINFTSPFCTCTPKSAGCAAVVTAVKQLGDIPLKQVALKDQYLDIVQHPAHGHGSGMNPCIDCRILKIKKAGEYMKQIGASFIFTGEVLGQRPMSQQRKSMNLIDNASGLRGYILRPLSASHFEPTIAEKEGWVDRSRLLDISGRSRKIQISLADEKGITDYPCPAGGCLLTDKHFSDRIRDYFLHTDTPSIGDIALLKVGRHFRLDDGSKVIVARDEPECRAMQNLYQQDDHLLVPVDFPGPTVILQGTDFQAALEKLIAYTKGSIRETDRIEHTFHGKKEIVAPPAE